MKLLNKQRKELKKVILVNEIKGRIISKGYTTNEFAKALGISSKTFYNKLNKGVFGSDEIEKMINLLDIKEPMAIFFANEVTQ